MKIPLNAVALRSRMDYSTKNPTRVWHRLRRKQRGSNYLETICKIKRWEGAFAVRRYTTAIRRDALCKRCWPEEEAL